MVKAEIVVKTRISITKQKQPTTHYKAKEAIIILSRNNSQMAIKDKHFQSTIKKILKIGVGCMPTLAIFLLTDFQVFFEFEGGPKASTNLPFLSAPIATLVISIISYKIGSYLKKRFK
ncbi:MAG: hypothetical protein IS860_06910 [Nitrosopumilus sp.]|nr:hypothetical protein [Nitrosopumilus sp.]